MQWTTATNATIATPKLLRELFTGSRHHPLPNFFHHSRAPEIECRPTLPQADDKLLFFRRATLISVICKSL